MNFKELLEDARTSNTSAEKIIEMYQPMLAKASILDGVFDEDLYQELCLTLIECVQKFKIQAKS